MEKPKRHVIVLTEHEFDYLLPILLDISIGLGKHGELGKLYAAKLVASIMGQVALWEEIIDA